MTDPSQWKPLTPAFTAALRRYDRAAAARLRQAERRNAITTPLYHYTPTRAALESIITNRQFWFTHYKHLNDKTEIEFGMNAAKATLIEIGARKTEVSIFCEMVLDLFSADNLNSAFEFYISSYTRNRDDLYQWKNYADCGKGFAIGLAPRLFGIEDKPDRKPHENVFVSPVSYGKAAGRLLNLPAIEGAARIVADTAAQQANALADINRGMPFFDEMGKRLIACELILNSLIVKHCDWSPEHEVRQFILGETARLAPYVSTRNRDAEIVPYIKGDMPLQRPGSIVEILIGPAAPADAEGFACGLLATFHSDPRSIVRRSEIILGGIRV